ncbi:MAG TPA: hypothetical protein VF188_16880 [Longimicrobiales bacterium]
MARSRHHGRAGAVLLEVMIALTVLATVGGTAAWMCSEAIRAVGRAHAAEAEIRAAQRFMAAVSLWPREDLDRHLGDSPQGSWRLRVDRVRPDLYEVSLADTATGRVLLGTALFRPETPVQ